MSLCLYLHSLCRFDRIVNIHPSTGKTNPIAPKSDSRNEPEATLA